MHFESLSAFFDMGGYAFYVWLSYGVSFALLLGLTISSVTARKRIINNIRAKQAREKKLKEYRKGKENNEPET